jgi:hypothetical protein
MSRVYTAPVEKIFDTRYEMELRRELLPGGGPELRTLYSAQLAVLADAHFQGDFSADMDLFNAIWEKREQLDARLGQAALSRNFGKPQTGQQG